MGNVSGKICRGNKTFCCQEVLFFLKSCCLWDNVEKYCAVGQAVHDNITKRMRFACWITKATNPHREYLILVALPLQQWVQENASILRHAYQGADKSLARPGKKQARKHVRDARDFNNIETRAVIKFFFPARQGAEGNSLHSDRNISLFPSWRAEDLSAPLYNAPLVLSSKHIFSTTYVIFNQLLISLFSFTKGFVSATNMNNNQYDW